MFLPFPVLLKSRIQKRKKAVLLGLLALGTFITIIQVIRIQTIRNLSNYLDSAGVIMWSAVENNLGVIVASIPTLAPLFTFFVDKTQRSSSGNSKGRALYEFRSKRSTRQASIPLGSVVHAASHNRLPSLDRGSQEAILSRDGTITRKTEVTVSSRPCDGHP
jgi:hypothetical protein